MADNYEITNTLENLQKAAEVLDNNMHEMRLKLQAPHLYLDPFKVDASSNALNEVQKNVATFKDSVLALLKQLKEKTEEWQQTNENIIRSNLIIRDALRQTEIRLEQYGYKPLSDIKILEASKFSESHFEQHLTPAINVESEQEICKEENSISNDTLVTPMICRKSKSQQSIEKVVCQSQEEHTVKGNDGGKESVSNVKDCDLATNGKHKDTEEDTVKVGTHEELENIEASKSGCGNYSVYYYELMKARKEKDQTDIVDDEPNKNKSCENATHGKYSVYYYELMKKCGKNQGQ